MTKKPNQPAGPNSPGPGPKPPPPSRPAPTRPTPPGPTPPGPAPVKTLLPGPYVGRHRAHHAEPTPLYFATLVDLAAADPR